MTSYRCITAKLPIEKDLISCVAEVSPEFKTAEMRWPDRGVELARLIINQSDGNIITTVSRGTKDRHKLILTMRREYYDKSTMYALSKVKSKEFTLLIFSGV